MATTAGSVKFTVSVRACRKARSHFFTFFAYLCTVNKQILSSIALLSLLSCGTLRQGGTAVTSPATDTLLTREVGFADVPEKENKEESVSAPQSPSPSQTAPVSVSQETLADQVIAYARTFLGTPYKLGASGPKLFDCSGFTRYVFKHFGYNLTQYSGAQFSEGREVPGYSDLQKGDLVFFGKRGSVRNIGHVGIVVSVNEEKGSFSFIHASTSGGVIESESTQAYYMMRYIGARRILPDEDRKD